MVPALGPKCSTCNRRRRSIIAVDIASFFVAVAVGQWTSYRLISSSGRLPPLWVSVAGTAGGDQLRRAHVRSRRTFRCSKKPLPAPMAEPDGSRGISKLRAT